MALQFLMSSLGLASALGIAALGVVSLRGGRSRPPGAFAFGIFCLLWGLQIGLGNLANLSRDGNTVRFLVLAMQVCLIAIPYFLAEFVLAQLGGRSRLARAWRWGTIALAFTATAVFLFRPTLLIEGFVERAGYHDPVYGPGHVILVTIPFFTSFALALVGLAVARRLASTPRVARRAAILLAGLALYVGYAAGNNLAFYLGALLAPDGELTLGLFLVPFLVLAGMAIWIGTGLLLDARGKVPDEARTDRLLALALLGPMLVGAVEALVVLNADAALGLGSFETVGLWRLAGVAFLTYGIARWRLYDLPQRATRAAAAATGAAGAVATGAAAYGAGTLASSGSVLPVVAGLLVLGAALFPALSFARRLFGIETDVPRRDLEEALYGQRIEAYRAALEASLARATLHEDQAFLAALRERFSISPDEDRVLTHLAKSSVVIARSRHAWDAYERLRLLGEGGGGRTWLARDRARDRLVVLKEPLERWQQEPTAREAVLREARMAARVRHANVVAVEEVVEGKGSPVIVMEYLEGGSLADLLRARGTLPWRDARALMLDILAGVEAIHAAGIVHRDLKPSNILLTSEGVAKVADFGIAVSPGTSGQRTMVMDPLASTVAGTLNYMAPESRAGAAPDKRSDVYSCAAVLHEMLYGAPPGLHSPIVVRKDLPAETAQLLARALAAKPEARVPSARAFAEALVTLP